MEKLRELRKQNNLTQSDMAAILGISRQAYSNYELGTREADHITLIKLADYFNVTTDYLLGRDTTKSSTDNVKVAVFGGNEEVTDEMWDEVKNFVEYVKVKYKNKKD